MVKVARATRPDSPNGTRCESGTSRKVVVVAAAAGGNKVGLGSHKGASGIAGAGGRGGGGSNYSNARLGESEITNSVSTGLCLVDRPVYRECDGVIQPSW